MIPILVLDIGGVFFLDKTNRAFFSRWAKQTSLDPLKLENLLWFGPDIEQANIGEITAEVYFQRTAKRLGTAPSIIRAIIEDAFCGKLNNDLVIFVRQLKLKQVRVAALTNNWSFGRELIERQGITDLFDLIITSAEEGVKKPHIGIYQIMLDRLKVEANEVIFVDDTLENIETAQKLGIRSIWFQSTAKTISELKGVFACHQVDTS